MKEEMNNKGIKTIQLLKLVLLQLLCLLLSLPINAVVGLVLTSLVDNADLIYAFISVIFSCAFLIFLCYRFLGWTVRNTVWSFILGQIITWTIFIADYYYSFSLLETSIEFIPMPFNYIIILFNNIVNIIVYYSLGLLTHLFLPKRTF